MATLYFTSTAATGDGTFRNTVLNAADGDIIMPDPEVFHTSEEVVVELQATLYPVSNVVINAGNTRLVVKHTTGIVVYARTSSGCSVFSASGCTFIGRVILAGDASTIITATFDRCIFGGNSASSYLLQASSGYTSLTLNDCLLTGSLTHTIYVSGNNTSGVINRSTIAGNKGESLYGNAAGNVVLVDCISSPNLATAGFKNVPTSLDSYSTSNLPPWDTWNFSLLPTSEYATGAVTAAGHVDILGNTRGWYDGATLNYALGAYEVVVRSYNETSAYFYAGYLVESSSCAYIQ